MTMNTAVRSAPARSLRAITAVLSIALLFNQFAYAAGVPDAPAAVQTPQTASPPQAPLPTQIAAAHTVFLVNNGADQNFPISADSSYNDIYAALLAWGHFQLVSSPAQADLVFQLRDIAPLTEVTGNNGGVYSISSPAFQLTIKDPKTNVTLWTITSPVQLAGSKSARASWLNIAITNLVSRVKVVANQPLSETETTDLILAPHNHRLALGITLAAVLIGASIATGFIMKHEFDKDVANQNAKLCAENVFFCTTP
jgi:hypothetical protein